ncbi:MAG TPA: thioredoxin domain-containing protein, partial [Desulfobacterales bacterium]|nr:thioredoxin domain-containing protein [Desulfobacterales bacterium]
GGWPLTIVMTPDGKPFFAATYVPRGNAYGRTGMLELVPRIGGLWRSRREDVLSSADSIADEIVRLAEAPAGGGVFDEASLVRAAGAIAAGFDTGHGGFGEAPKFPMPTVYPFLLRAWRRSGDAALLGMIEKSLAAMRNGGIYDQLGFGFHRYATDAAWLVPHFEKMLYDQALLALAYTETWQATANDFYRRTALEVFAYAMRDLRSPEGAFFAAEDADSEGEEGKFYLWSAREIASVLGAEDAEWFMQVYGVSKEGNCDAPGTGAAGANILNRKPDDTRAPGAAEEKLRGVREGRVRPFRDDTMLADWNGLMIAALARAGAAFDEPSLTEAALRAADFILGHMRGRDGRLFHRWRDGEAGIPAFPDDHAFLAWGLLELYAAGFDTRYLEAAIEITDDFVARFRDDTDGGFFQAAADAVDGRALRRKAITDGVIPSANSAGLFVLARLAQITGRQDYRRKAEQLVRQYPRNAPDAALSFGAFFSALDLVVGPSQEVVVAGDPAAADTKAMLAELRRRYLPRATVIL